MRRLALLAVLVLGCGGQDGGKPRPPVPGSGGETGTGGSGGTTGGSGGSSVGGSGGAVGGSGGSAGSGGSGGSTGGSGGGGAGGSAADASSGDGPAATYDAPAGVVLGPGSADDAPPLVLPGSHLIFDGQTLTGWMCDSRWSVKDGTIDGTGSGNSFCKTADDHDTFRLTGKSRIVKDPSNHAGICFWGTRTGGCLQITPVSGSLWDYRGGGEVRTLPRTRDYTKWSFFELLVDAKTGTVDIAVEGHAFPTYTDKKTRNKGPIGLQLHAQPNEVQYKDLSLEDNPTMPKLLTAQPGK
jgi:hypothetical protein